MIRQVKAFLIVVALVVASVLILFMTPLRRLLVPAGPPDAATVARRLELARAALSATENLDTAGAEVDWSELHRQVPEDRSVALNRALNRLLHLDALTESSTNVLLDEAARQTARAQLPAAIVAARASVEDYVAAGGDPAMRIWLASRIDLQEASLLSPADSRVARQQIFSRLCDAVESEAQGTPGSAILGGPLLRVIDELESPTAGIPEDVLTRAARAVGRLSGQQPDNLYVALRAGRLGLAARSADSSGAILRTRELARAIEPSLRESLESIGLTPDDLVKEILDAILLQDWQAAEGQMNLWFNVLNSTDLVKTDRRRVSPHPLDRLSFDILRRLSAEVAGDHPLVPGKAPLSFRSVATIGDEEVIAALPVDVDMDLVPEVVLVTAAGGVSVWKSDAEGQWGRLARLDLGIACKGLIAADLFMVDASDPRRLQVAASRGGEGAPPPPARHTTLPTLVVYGDGGAKLVAVDGRAGTAEADRLRTVEGETGLEDLSQVTCVVAGDWEGDGDLDLVFATQDRGVRFFINRGNRTFFELDLGEQAAAMAKLTNLSAMAIVDLDRDLDLDVVTVDAITGRVGLLENLLHLQFRYRPLDEIPPVIGAEQLQIADLDGNVSWDIITGSPRGVQVTYSHTSEAGVWTADRTEEWGRERGRFLLADFDNDGWNELLIRKQGESVGYRFMGAAPEQMVEVSGDLSGEFSAFVDFDLDGRLDVLSIVEGGCQVSRNVTEEVGHHLAVRIRGIEDNNPSSGRVNHYAIGSVVELRFGPHYRAQVITTPSTHFGLDGFDTAGSLRIIFPNGLTQTIPRPPVDALVEEEQTLKGSCPYLYAWDGEKFAFVTDCLWAAPLGLQVASGVVAKDRPWEYLKVDGKYVKPRDGRYDLRITEELWEIAYFDHVSLVAVDHPAGVEIWTNEKVGPPEIATPRIYAFSSDETLPLVEGHDTSGRNVTETLSAVDGQYVQGFDRRLRQGLCPPHWVDLDFGPLPRGDDEGESEASIYLVMTGWILPTDTSLNIQIDQNPELGPLEFPSVWVPDTSQSDGWRKAIPFMGFPGGKTKTIVVDVTDAMNRDDPRLRVRTSAQIYWDAASLVVQQTVPEVVVHDVTLVEADLRYRGFSDKVRRSSTAPEVYDYSKVTESPKWPPLQGRFTVPGDCMSLLGQWDDRMVVMGSGDEIRLSFAVPQAEVPPGWKRDFVLHCVGWDKDADLNTLSGQSSEPLPFREMTGYPPRPDQAEQSSRVESLNRDHLLRTQSFRAFWSRQ